MPIPEKTSDHPLATTVKWRFPSIHPEGRKFVVIAAVAALAVYTLISHFVGWLLIGVTLWVAAFFRDPVRTTPRGDKFVVAPADGLITMIVKVPPPPELREARTNRSARRRQIGSVRSRSQASAAPSTSGRSRSRTVAW